MDMSRNTHAGGYKVVYGLKIRPGGAVANEDTRKAIPTMMDRGTGGIPGFGDRV